ncbi:MAG: methylated-DNA--[protein]-cysteine S-methyltransferase [Dehalococcoidia bacterium]|nr:methylated-DNA--[protein]-cysteine S-methyltransferase [Dehalococcoidia bacterium]
MTTAYDTIESPVGLLFIAATEHGVTHIGFLDNERDLLPCVTRFEAETGESATRGGPECHEVRRQLTEYFAGRRTAFELTLAPNGTEWQRKVWHALSRIPKGETVAYGTIATRLGRPSASRAVGAANGRNPIAIIVPCHRVVGSNGTLTGYAGGLHRKQWLLAHEGVRLALDEPDAVLAG